MAAKSAARDAPDELFAAIVELSEQLKAAQQSGAATVSLISASVPLFARLRALVREGSLDSRQRKETALEARKEVDAANLALQNLQYEQAHLEREIRACQNYECVGAVVVTLIAQRRVWPRAARLGGRVCRGDWPRGAPGGSARSHDCAAEA